MIRQYDNKFIIRSSQLIVVTQRNNPVNLQYERHLTSHEDFMCITRNLLSDSAKC